MIEDFSGKTAFITGAASGIGLAMAQAFAARGMTVAVADIQADVIEPAVQEIKAAGGKAIGVQVDVTDRAAVQAVVEDLSTWPEWSAWNKERDPQAEWSFEGEPGAGMRWSWQSEGPLGTGSLTVTGSTPERVDFQLRFEDSSGLMEASDAMVLTPTEEGTQVTWAMDHTFDPLLLRWIVQLGVFDAMLGADYEAGLTGLGERLAPESADAAQPAAGDPETEEPKTEAPASGE